MNLLAVCLISIASVGIKNKHHSVRKLVANDAYIKLLIIVGALKWYDMPHLHHPLIHFRIGIEERMNLL